MGFFSKKKVLVTHDGVFHADDIFATATLMLLLKEDVEIVRTREDQKIALGDYVYDVGGEYAPEKNRFDHHQEGGAGKRENGIPYAAFGLVWKTYGENVCGSKEIAQRIDERLVQAVDADDNAVTLEDWKFPDVKSYRIQSLFGVFRPTWEEEKNHDAVFEMLAMLAKKIILREIAHAKGIIDAREKVLADYAASEDKRIVVLNGEYPMGDTLESFAEPLFLVAKRTDGKWHAHGIAKTPGSFERKKDFPKAWAGKRDEELQQITGVPDAVFCHNGLFIAVALSKEGALKLAQIALES